MRIYNSCGRLYRYNFSNPAYEEWEFWCGGGWVYSEDANQLYSPFHEEWRQDLKLVGNNFRLK